MILRLSNPSPHLPAILILIQDLKDVLSSVWHYLNDPHQIGNIEIKITAKWGSEFQRSVSYQVLVIMLKAWLAFRRATHKKNAVSVSLDGADLDAMQIDGV